MTEPREFSRRVDVRIIKDEPMSIEQWADKCGECAPETVSECKDGCKNSYALYVEKFQPYRFHAKAKNFEIISVGESYHNEADVINAVELLFGDDTTCYWAREYGEERGLNLLRYGKTDLNRIQGMSKDG